MMQLSPPRLLGSMISALLLGSASGPAFSADKPNYERETRIAEQIEPGIFDGEALWLNASEREFLAIYTEAEGATGAVVLLHGRDANPEEQHLIGPLRVGLAENGWSTLALQMPVLAKGNQYYDYLPVLKFAAPRIDSAMTWLRDRGYQTVVLGAHSCGAHMANHWLNASGEQGLDGYIAMGLGATDAGQELKTPIPIGSMTIPVLDIYGAEEFERPLSMVPERQQMLVDNGNRHSAQVVVPDTNHYFHDAGETMVGHLTEWLDSIRE